MHGGGGSRVHTFQWLRLVAPDGSRVKNLPANAGDTGSNPGQENPVEKEMATQYTILTWEIPWTEESGRLQLIGSQKNQT